MLEWIRQCFACTSCWPPVDLFCRDCWGKLRRQRQPQWRSLQRTDLKVFSIWDWHPGDQDIERLIHGRKSLFFSRAHERLAGELVRLLPAELCSLPIVYPGKPLGQRDHCQDLAHALARQTGQKLVRVEIESAGFYKTQTVEQRLRGRQARVVGGPLGKRFLFIDDVLTTGATARAARRALGDPPVWFVAVLAYRTRTSE